MGFLFFPVMPMGLRWAALRAAGAPLKRTIHVLCQRPCGGGLIFHNGRINVKALRLAG